MSVLNDLSSPNWQIRRQTVEALLHGYTPEASTQGLAQDDQPQELALQELQQGLLDLLRTSHQDLGALNAALQTLTGLGAPVLAGLGQLLQDPDAETRALAASALGEQRDERALPLLLQALDDANTNVRFNSLEALGKLGSRRAVEPLLAVLEQGHAYLSFPAIQSLAQLGDPTVSPTLIDLLADELLSSPAAEALGQLSDPDILPYLAAWLESPVGDAASAAAALGNLYRRCERLWYPGACGTDLLQDLARQQIGPAGRQKILAELERFARRPERQGDHLPDLVRLAGWLVPPHTGDPGAPPSGIIRRLQAALAQLLDRPEVRHLAGEALGRLGEAALPDLLARLADPSIEVRCTAAAALGEIKSSQAVPALLALLDTPDPAAAASAASALGRIGDPAAFHPLCAHLDHPAAIVRQAILTAIHLLGHPEHTPVMLALARSGSPLVREAAIRSLGYFGAPGTAEAVLSAVNDPAEAVRKAAVAGLPFLDDPRSPGVLAEVLKGGPPALRAAAALALGHAQAGFARPLLRQALRDADTWTRLYACRALDQLNESLPPRGDASQPFLSLLADPMPPVRSAAAAALGHSGDQRAISALQPLLNDAEEDVVLAAIEALANTHRPQAVPLLAALLENQTDRICAAALAGLGQHGSRRALQIVHKAARSPAARVPAVQALAGEPHALVHLLADPLLRRPPAAQEIMETLLKLGRPGSSTHPATTRLVDAAQSALRSQPASPHARRSLAELLYQLGALYEPDLLAGLLADPDAGVRQIAILALVETRTAGADAWVNALAAHDPHAGVRSTAQRAARYLRLLSPPGTAADGGL